MLNLILTILAVVLIIFGVFKIIGGALLLGIILVVVGLLVAAYFNGDRLRL